MCLKRYRLQNMTIQGSEKECDAYKGDKTGIHSYRLDMTNLSELAKSRLFYIYIRQGM